MAGEKNELAPASCSSTVGPATSSVRAASTPAPPVTVRGNAPTSPQSEPSPTEKYTSTVVSSAAGAVVEVGWAVEVGWVVEEGSLVGEPPVVVVLASSS